MSLDTFFAAMGRNNTNKLAIQFQSVANTSVQCLILQCQNAVVSRPEVSRYPPLPCNGQLVSLLGVCVPRRTQHDITLRP